MNQILVLVSSAPITITSLVSRADHKLFSDHLLTQPHNGKSNTQLSEKKSLIIMRQIENNAMLIDHMPMFFGAKMCEAFWLLADLA